MEIPLQQVPRSDDHSTFYLTPAVFCSPLVELQSASVLHTASRLVFASYPVRRISQPAPVSADGGGVQEVHCAGDKRQEQTQRLGFLQTRAYSCLSGVTDGMNNTACRSWTSP